METCTDGKRGEKGEGGEGCVGDDDPTGGERDGGKLVACAVRHEQGEGKNGVAQCSYAIIYMYICIVAPSTPASTPGHLGQRNGKERTVIRSTTLARSSLNTQIHGSNEAGKVPSSL